MKKYVIFLLINFSFTISYCQFPDYDIKNDSIVKYLIRNNIEFINPRFGGTYEKSKPNILNCSDWNGQFVEKTDTNKMTSTYDDGTLREVQQFINGRSNRISIMYYAHSKEIFSEIEFKNDLIWNAKFYNKQGKILSQGTFKNGTGLLKYYRQNGTICMISNYKSGLLDGKIQYLYSNGKNMLYGQCLLGKKIGIWKELNIEGVEVTKTKY